MSSRRDLKKLINNSIGLLYNDLIFYKVFTVNANKEKADALIDQIADSHLELINRVSTVEGKEVKSRTKAYYSKIKSDLKSLVDNYGKEIQTL
ncbi:hypothetical protein [Dysgonomonas capnocytophagoides]|uniref:hypothetical protein n=1 Tax=Dysgonomonas capnocytophagoides TaxID=45254 RepID=UPI003340B1E9